MTTMRIRHKNRLKPSDFFEVDEHDLCYLELFIAAAWSNIKHDVEAWSPQSTLYIFYILMWLWDFICRDHFKHNWAFKNIFKKYHTGMFSNFNNTSLYGCVYMWTLAHTAVWSSICLFRALIILWLLKNLMTYKISCPPERDNKMKVNSPCRD